MSGGIADHDGQAVVEAPWLGRYLPVVWVAFMSACVLELLVFWLVDPLDLHLADWSRGAVYTAAFFAFWAVSAGSNVMAVFLGSSRARSSVRRS